MLAPLDSFEARVARIPPHGAGLSVDVYSPDLCALVQQLARVQTPAAYLEVFKASEPVLAEVRQRVPDIPLAYHGEGLWITQPYMARRYPVEAELWTAHAQLVALGSDWINYECATKQMAGYSFGTYLPPLFTADAAEVTARNAVWVQARLDALSWGGRAAPLLLLELPPLTYFGIGDLPAAAFFQRIAERAPCGFVLDIGHIWTHWRYASYGRMSLERYLNRFLCDFPLNRVVQIHVAGLAPHDRDAPSGHDELPRWLDAHPAPIPTVLYDMLDAVLAHPALIHLRGVALEVDGKAIELTVEEYGAFQARYAGRLRRLVEKPVDHTMRHVGLPAGEPNDAAVCDPVERHYGTYARMVSSCAAGDLPVDLPLQGDRADVRRYREDYLPHEILTWGGTLRDMFPETCRMLDANAVGLSAFVAYWFREPRPAERPYDFFELKIERFVEFVGERLPSAHDCVRREAALLRAGYLTACDKMVTSDV